MTILESTKVIFRKEPEGLTCRELTSRILSENLCSSFFATMKNVT